MSISWGRLISGVFSSHTGKSSVRRKKHARISRSIGHEFELLEPRQLLSATPTLYWVSGDADTNLQSQWSTTAKNWNTASDGSGKQTAWINGANAIFLYDSLVNIDVLNSVSVSSLTVEGNGIVITGGKLAMTGSATINAQKDTSIDSIITGSRGLKVTGTATLTLTGGNTYSGTTTVSALSTLQIGVVGNTASLKSSTIQIDGTVKLYYTDNTVLSQTLKGGGKLDLVGPAAITLRGNNNFAGKITVSNGGLVLANANALNRSTLELQALTTFSFGTLTSAKIGGLSGDQDILLENTKGKAVALTLNNGFTQFNGGSEFATYSGSLSGKGSLTVSGIQTLTGFCGYQGATTVLSGMLTLDGDCTSLGSVVISKTKNAAQLIINTSVTFDSFSGGGKTTINNNGSLVLGFDNKNVTYNGEIAGSGRLVKVGTGTLILTDRCLNYTGTIHATDGIVKFSYNNNTLPIGVGMHLNISGGSINFGTMTSMQIAGLTGNGNLVLANEKNKPIDLTIAVSNGTDVFSGQISGAGSLTKRSSGTLQLTGQNTYTGTTTILNGTLQVDGSIASTIVAGGGILTGTGKIQQISMTNQTSLRLYGQNQLGNLLLNSTGMNVAIAGNNTGDYTQLTVSGLVVLSNSSLTMMYNTPRTVATGKTFVIVNNTGSAPVIGTFRDLPEGSIIEVDGLNYKISYVGGDGNDITLTDVL